MPIILHYKTVTSFYNRTVYVQKNSLIYFQAPFLLQHHPTLVIAKQVQTKLLKIVLHVTNKTWFKLIDIFFLCAVLDIINVNLNT